MAASRRRIRMRGWSDDELKLLRKLHCQGKSAREIQEQLPDKTIHQVRAFITRKRDEYGLEDRLKGTPMYEQPDSFNTDSCRDLLRRKW